MEQVSGGAMNRAFKTESFERRQVYKDSKGAGTVRIHLFPGARPTRRRRTPLRGLAAEDSARIRLTRAQGLTLLGVLAALGLAVALAPMATGHAACMTLWLLFAGNAVLRLAAAALPQGAGRTPYLHPGLLPRYTVIVALYHEAGIAAQVLSAMLALRYPKTRLDIVFALEEDDAETIAALSALDLPGHVSLSLTPPGFPRTKPRALNHALMHLHLCRLCNNFSEAEVCEVCASPNRDKRQLAVVELPADFNMMEATQSYGGLYFVLMGRLSPLDGIGPREIHLDRLISRALDGVVEEVILATNFTPEGEATAHTIGELLKARGLKVSRLARGVPVGGELEYVDSGTLAQAVRDRRTV